ncbi:hypothetical protein EK21DRAFT_84062 [Setomelanomma holmii]|uniref:Uncharacterized protein n=1 Tax=Setomelanomma holmii TaxID=210430 RepID=A0A9P4HJE5_9PLEO|nr:hypothetical protein EK21DRAFT_84062 [Setomelanomma holmii]
MDRMSTPPLEDYFLTPPPTGGIDKCESFVDFETKISKEIPNSRRSKTAKEGESSTAFFEEIQGGSDIDLIELSEDESHSATDKSVPASPAPTAPETDNPENHALFALPTSIHHPVPTEPFRFLDLPVSIRRRIYTHLLVIPALICVRQNTTSPVSSHTTFLDTERRSLLTGISNAHAVLTVNGPSIPFSRFTYTNVAILRARKEIHIEARTVLYARNAFAIQRPSLEMSPPTDFSVRLFPAGAQRLVTSLTIQIRTFYGLEWLFSKGQVQLRNYYRGLKTMVLVLELDGTHKGFGRKWARHDDEKWEMYVKRLAADVTRIVCDEQMLRVGRVVPGWSELRVMFGGEAYDVEIGIIASIDSVEQGKREDLRDAMMEVWDMFQSGGR